MIIHKAVNFILLATLTIALVFLTLSNDVRAKAFVINEPVLNSQVYVELHGDKNKPAILLVHGLGDEASTIWKQTITELKDRFYIMALDLPGFGHSSKRNSQYTPTNYSHMLNYLSNKYIGKPFVLVGHSFGGAVSLKFTSLFPKKVSKLVLIDVAGILHKDAYSSFIIAKNINKFTDFNTKNHTNDSKIGSFISNVLSKTEKVLPFGIDVLVNTPLREYTNPHVITAISLVSEDYTKIPESILQKTLIIWGEEDDIAPIRTAYVLDKLIPKSQLSVVKNSAHVPMTTNFYEYYHYLNNFLMGYPKKNTQENLPVKHDDTVIIYKMKNNVLSGHYKKLIIQKSNNILLKNCVIEHLVIYDSDVHLFNSRVNNDQVAITVDYSNLVITTSTIKSKKPIVSQSSKLDIAGSTLQGEDAIIFNNTINNKKDNTQIILSLSKLITNSNKRSGHGKRKLIGNGKL